ncbi:MAG: glycosyltransferase [Actinomycetia bacterium]|nr:glycosyltransferase [Actinomycetes bacterium]
MNIAQLSYADVAGGAEQVALDLHRALRDFGDAATLFVGARNSEEAGCFPLPNERYRGLWARALLRFAPEVSAARTSTGALLRRRALQAGAEPLRAARKALGFDDYDYPASARVVELADVALDVIHLHNPLYYFDMRALPKLSHQVPFVITAHSVWTGTGRCAYPIECPRWKTGCGQCPHPEHPPVAPFDRTAANWRRKSALYNRSRLYLTAPAAWTLRLLEQSIMAAGVVEARVIPGGVDQSIFRPAKGEQERDRLRAALELAPGDFAIAYTAISAGNPYKDPATLQAALSAGAHRIVLIQMGAAEDSLTCEGALTRRSFAFRHDRSWTASVLQACDLYVHSARAEVAPLAILEAESCGLPVVASDVGGVRECVHPGKGSILVPAEEVDALTRAIEHYRSDPARTRAIGAEVATWAAGRFSHLTMAQRYREFYEEARRSFTAKAAF